MRVAYVAGEPTASRLPQMNLLARQPGIDLTSIYAGHSLQGRNWSLEHTHRTIILRGVSLPLSRLLHHTYPVTPGILRLLRRERFDVLVIGGWSVFACQVAILWARATGTPYLVFSENHDREPRPGWIGTLRRFVLPHVVGPAAGNLVTGSLAAEHVASFGADPAHITRFPNTIDVEAVGRRADEARGRGAETRRTLGIAGDAFVVLQVSRLLPVKGVDVTIDAVAALDAAALVVVGDGPERLALEERARAAGIDARFTGFLDGDALIDAYAASDVLAQLSRRETWGVVVNEAMACGLPVVASERVGAAADLIRDGENGYVVPADDAAAAAAALARLAADPAERERFGARSRELVADWGYETGVRELARVLRAVTS